nr:DNA-binding anti-repressor SinI [Anaerobacillus isosaccharinicus]QOY38507.1 anti-repressor SinI family protein [Anaerobacillus isosaccharinicus]
MKEMLDQEWIELMLCAKQMGLTIVEIELFLRNSSKIKTNEDLNLNHDLSETKAL